MTRAVVGPKRALRLGEDGCKRQIHDARDVGFITPDEAQQALSAHFAIRIARDAALRSSKTEEVTPAPTTPTDESLASSAVAVDPGLVWDHLVWDQLSNIEVRSIVFRDKPLLQADAAHLIAGRKGAGKGTLIAEIGSRVTRGELGPNRNVVWIGSEDSASIDIKPRMIAAHGDPARVTVVTSGWVQLPRDFDQIDAKMTEVGEIGLLVIDPVGNHITGKSSNAETDIRDAIAPLNQLADKHRCMVFAVRHLSEKECGRGVLAAILGSSAWVQVPRVVIAVVRDSEDPNVSHVQCVAGNRLPPDTPGRMFRIEGVLLPGLENEVTRATWIGDSGQDVEAMLAATADREHSKSAVARKLILDILNNTPQIESGALDAQVAQEVGISQKTVRNLRGNLKNDGLIRAIPEKDEHGVVIRWNVALAANLPAPARSS